MWFSQFIRNSSGHLSCQNVCYRWLGQDTALLQPKFQTQILPISGLKETETSILELREERTRTHWIDAQKGPPGEEGLHTCRLPKKNQKGSALVCQTTRSGTSFLKSISWLSSLQIQWVIAQNDALINGPWHKLPWSQDTLSRCLHTETRYRPQIPDLESKQAPMASPKGGQRPTDSSHVYGLLFQVWGVSLTNGFVIVTSLLKKNLCSYNKNNLRFTNYYYGWSAGFWK